MSRDIHVALARASKAGRGIRLSADEVRRLVARDHAIATAAETCNTECVCDILRAGGQCEYCEAKEKT